LNFLLGLIVIKLAGLPYKRLMTIGVLLCIPMVAHANTEIEIKRHFVYAPGTQESTPEKTEPKVVENTDGNNSVQPAISKKKKESSEKKYNHTIGDVHAQEPFTFDEEFHRDKYSDRPYPIRRTGYRPHAPYVGFGPRRAIEDVIRSSVTFDISESSLLNIDREAKPQIKKYGKIYHQSNKIQIDNGAIIELDMATLESESMALSLDGREFVAEHDIHFYTEGSDLTAQKIRIKRSELEAEEESEDVNRPARPLLPSNFTYMENAPGFLGEVQIEQLELNEGDKYFNMEYLYFDTVNNTGVITQGYGRSDIFYFNADEIKITGPQSIEATNLWLTTCDNPEPHYKLRIRDAVIQDGRISRGEKARFQFRNWHIPFYLPRISGMGKNVNRVEHLGFDIDAGNESDLGYYINLGQWYEYSPNVDYALRFFPTSRNGIGGGVDVEYDFMDDPASRFFHSSGEFNSLYTTRDDGYHHWYHRHEVSDDTLVLAQWEQWYNPKILKEFYQDNYEDRTGPRTFANVTHLGDGYILSGTASKSTHDFTTETEKFPDASFHLLERHLGKKVYLAMDSYAGYYHNTPSEVYSERYAHVARLSYDWNIMQGLNVVPFVEGAATHYSNSLDDGESDALYSTMAGVTTQARFQRSYRGLGKFEGFKHIVVPSISYINQESSSMDFQDVPRLNDIDDRPIRDRVETKLDHVVLGRNSVNAQTWRLAQLTFYHGYDLGNESDETDDFEIDFQIRPRPWWGFRTISERFRIDNPAIVGNDYKRITNYLFFNNSQYENTWNARIGYVETTVDDITAEKNILYGAGYKLNEAWSISADHQYSIEFDELVREQYELRRRLHMWEMGIIYRERNERSDLNFVFSLVGLNGTDIKM
jgi:hypothetical protein